MLSISTAHSHHIRQVRDYKMLAQDPQHIGTRGSHRYSFGEAVPGSWRRGRCSSVVSPPVLHTVLLEILGEDYTLAGWPSGGDFVLPGSLDYQELHRDGGDEVGEPGSGRPVCPTLSSSLLSLYTVF